VVQQDILSRFDFNGESAILLTLDHPCEEDSLLKQDLLSLGEEGFFFEQHIHITDLQEYNTISGDLNLDPANSLCVHLWCHATTTFRKWSHSSAIASTWAEGWIQNDVL
jgi:hypothetical protein